MNLVLEDYAKETVRLNLYIKQLCPHHVHTAVSTSCPQTATKQKLSRTKLLHLHVYETILDCKPMNIMKHIEFCELLPSMGVYWKSQ
jgi:hypothetical protein